MTMLPNRHLSIPLSGEGDDNIVYENYIETTIDPGNTLFIIAIFICISSLLGLPLFVKIGKCQKKYNHGGDTDADSGGQREEGDALAIYTSNSNLSSQIDASNLSFLQRCRRMSYSVVLFVLDHVIRRRKRAAHSGENMGWRREAVSRGMAREARDSMYIHQQELVQTDLTGSAVEISLRPNEDQAKTLETPPGYENRRNNQLEIHDPENLHQPSTPLSPVGFLSKSILFMWTIAKYDKETKRILRLAIPFTFSAVTETMSELVKLAIISQNLGTDAMIAFTMVDAIVGISSEFMGGWVEAISSLGSMAYGARNYELVGQYVQTSCIGYILCEIPAGIVWGLTIGKILLLMGFGSEVAVLAEQFVLIQVAINMMKGINEAVLDFLEVVEKEAYANIILCISYLVETGLVALFAIKTDATLVVLGLVMLVSKVFFFFLNVLVPSKMGWLKKFEIGLFGKCSFRNTAALKELFDVALPLAIGNMLACAEWEILTIFAAVLGPAEAATWVVLGFVWDIFESTTEAIGDASEVRCAYQLGKGRPALAKIAAYKSMFLASLLALSVTAIFLSLGDVLPSLLTQDPTIQAMLTELFPLMALGNVTNMGMVGWALIGAQGRYRLATGIAFGCSLFITIPIGAILTIWLNIDLQGLTFAVVVGYTVTAMLLSTFLLMSDWECLSKNIQERMAAEEDSDSDDDSSSSSSSSSRSDTHHHAMDQTSKNRSIAVGHFEIHPATPGTFIPPPPLATPVSPEAPNHHSKTKTAHSLPCIPVNHDSPPTNSHKKTTSKSSFNA